jgi:hypothetical protein
MAMNPLSEVAMTWLITFLRGRFVRSSVEYFVLHEDRLLAEWRVNNQRVLGRQTVREGAPPPPMRERRP